MLDTIQHTKPQESHRQSSPPAPAGRGSGAGEQQKGAACLAGEGGARGLPSEGGSPGHDLPAGNGGGGNLGHDGGGGSTFRPVATGSPKPGQLISAVELPFKLAIKLTFTFPVSITFNIPLNLQSKFYSEMPFTYSFYISLLNSLYTFPYESPLVPDSSWLGPR